MFFAMSTFPTTFGFRRRANNIFNTSTEKKCVSGQLPTLKQDQGSHVRPNPSSNILGDLLTIWLCCYAGFSYSCRASLQRWTGPAAWVWWRQTHSNTSTICPWGSFKALTKTSKTTWQRVSPLSRSVNLFVSVKVVCTVCTFFVSVFSLGWLQCYLFCF